MYGPKDFSYQKSERQSTEESFVHPRPRNNPKETIKYSCLKTVPVSRDKHIYIQTYTL